MSVPASPTARYAELHCHTNFSFLDGASAADDLVDRAVELGLTALGSRITRACTGWSGSRPPPARPGSDR